MFLEKQAMVKKYDGIDKQAQAYKYYNKKILVDPRPTS